jgi:hypothetical protein
MAAQVDRSEVNQQQLVELITTGRLEGSAAAGATTGAGA